MAILRGKVVSGIGNFSYWIEKLQEHYLRKTGMRLFPGTLNIELAEPYSLPAKAIRLEGHEYGGEVSVSMIPCTIFGKSAFILRTDKNEQGQGHHPKTIVEIATDVKLRDRFHLEDGDAVQIETAGLKNTGLRLRREHVCPLVQKWPEHCAPAILFCVLMIPQNANVALKKMRRAAEPEEKIPPARLVDLPN